MTKFNVAVPVVEVVEAANAHDAIRQLRNSLELNGFDVYEGELPDGAHAFESEPDAEVTRR